MIAGDVGVEIDVVGLLQAQLFGAGVECALAVFGRHVRRQRLGAQGLRMLAALAQRKVVERFAAGRQRGQQARGRRGIGLAQLGALRGQAVGVGAAYRLEELWADAPMTKYEYEE